MVVFGGFFCFFNFGFLLVLVLFGGLILFGLFGLFGELVVFGFFGGLGGLVIFWFFFCFGFLEILGGFILLGKLMLLFLLGFFCLFVVSNGNINILCR